MASIAKNFIPTINTVDYDHIYHYDNLDYFGVSELNRNSNSEKVKEYGKKMLKGDWLFEISFIYVGISSLEILNGEHRRKAIDYAKSKGAEINDIRVIFVDDTQECHKTQIMDALNSNKHWQIDDYISSWINQGIESYQYLKDFCFDEDHSKLHSKNRANYGKGALLFGQTYNKFKETYHTKDFYITEKDKKLAESRYEQIVRIIKALCFDSSDDYWIPIAESWFKISGDKQLMNTIKELPEGFETFYDKLYQRYKLQGTNSRKKWYNRFIETIQICYNEKYV